MELPRTINCVYRTMNRGEATMLVAFDIAAAFDTVVHEIHLRSLSYSLGIDYAALS